MSDNYNLNYSGKQDVSKYTKRFQNSSTYSQAIWIFSKISSFGETVITPANKNTPVYINTDLIVNGKIITNSDINHMEQIEAISDSKIEKLFDLQPVEYKFKSDNKNTQHYGVVAQDVANIYPELVNENNLGFKTVNNMELIPLLLLKMKKMQKEIDELKETNNN